MQKGKAGFVYVLTNPSLRENWVVIVGSEKQLGARSEELQNPHVPLPFEIYASLQTVRYKEVVKHVYNMIDRLRDLLPQQHRLFFNVNPQTVVDIFYQVADMIDDAKVVVYAANKEEKDEEERTPRRARFRFSMAKIRVGETIVFDPTGLRVRVVSDNQIEYRGRVYKLSPFVGTFMPPERRNESGSYQGCKYFSYKGRPLIELRMEYEQMKQQGSLF